MKRTLLKSFCLTLFWYGIAELATAQGIVVNMKDGTKVYYKASEVQSVGVYGYGEGPYDAPDDQAYVDLGLPSGTLWATMNVGAKNPEENGDYFAWGETIGYNGGKTIFNWTTYKYCSGDYNTMWKYCTSSAYGTVDDNKTELEPEDDAATANWGEAWKMPTIDQFNELVNKSYTTLEWTTLDGINGIKITSKSNLKSIFLPAAGYRYDSLEEEGLKGYYWSSSLESPYSCNKSEVLSIYNSGASTLSSYRQCGYSIRPVRAKK